jgi:alkylhydroperoxidase family enzyme
MTWLPVETALLPERDAVLGLKPDVYEALRNTLTLAWRIADSRLLDLCRLRLAQLVGARAETDSADQILLVQLEGWRSSSTSSFSERERAALSYAEQYHVDHRRITDEQKDELARHLSQREVVNFVWALHMNDAYARLLSLLDIEPDPPSSRLRAERVPPRERQPLGTTSGSSAPRFEGKFADIDPEFFESYRTLGRVVVRQALVDEVTSEAVRLHNASHQGCLY